MGVARLTASLNADHGEAVSLAEGPVEMTGTIHVRLIVGVGSTEVPDVGPVEWFRDGKLIGSSEWERIERKVESSLAVRDRDIVADPPLPFVEWIVSYAPPFDVKDGSVPAELCAVTGADTYVGRFETAPEPVIEPNPVTDALRAAGATDEAITLMDRRAGGQILDSTESREVLDTLRDLRLDGLSEGILVGLASLAETVRREYDQAKDAADRLRKATRQL